MAKRNIQERIDALASEVETATGDNLVALFVYGAMVREQRPHDPHPDIAVILRDASAAALDQLGPAIARWARAGERPPLIMSELSWRASTDVFPIEIEEMREAHTLLRGRDLFDDLTTDPEDLRRELEREARGKLLQLNVHYAAAVEDGRALADLLRESVKTFFVLFRAALRLAGRTPPAKHATLVQETAKLAGFDPSAFTWPLAQLGADKPASLAAHDPVGATYVDALGRFVAYVDQA